MNEIGMMLSVEFLALVAAFASLVGICVIIFTDRRKS